MNRSTKVSQDLGGALKDRDAATMLGGRSDPPHQNAEPLPGGTMRSVVTGRPDRPRGTSSCRLRHALASLTGALSLLVATGCVSEHEPAGPQSGPVPELLGSAIRLLVDVEAGRVTVAPPPAVTASAKPGGVTPSFALMGQNEIGLAASNFFRSAVGQFTPRRVRVRFDIALTNKLANADLVPSTFPAPPSGVAQVLAFPFATHPSGVFVLRVTASTDWDGTGAPGSGAPHNFFNDAICIGQTPPSDCFRWEAFGDMVEGGATTPARTVGFDVDPSVTQFTLYVVIAADIREHGALGRAAVAGNVRSAARGPLQDVTVSVGASTAVTSGAGFYALARLAAGPANLVLSGLPQECENPGPTSVTLIEGEVTNGSLDVLCRGRVSGRVISPQLGPLHGVTVSVQGTAISSTTDAAGQYLLVGIDADVAVLLLSGLVGDCRAPPPLSVSVPRGRTATAPDLHVACEPVHVVFTAPGLGGADDIYTMRVDGSDRHQLTFTAEDESFPALSPDGTRIAFNRGQIGLSATIWTMNADGTAETAEASGSWSWPRPRWMFDGERLVTVNQLGSFGQTRAAIVMYTFGTPVPVPVADIVGFFPTPAYNDGRIAHVGVSNLLDHITLLDVDAIVPLSIGLPLDIPRVVRGLNWAPDGSRVVFESGAGLPLNRDIVTRSTDPSGGTVVLTSGPDDDSEPVYSPDGTLIYFIRNGALYRMNADGTNPVEIVPAAEFGGRAIDVR